MATMSGAEAAPDMDIANVVFKKSECLTLSEVAVIMRHRSEEQQQPLSNMFKATQDYVERFGRFRTAEAVKQMRTLLANAGLAENEAVALADLCPESAHEARVLIPSLARLDDDRLEAIIADLASFRQMQ